MDSSLWYATLEKPVWAPPAYLFGPVWTILYLIIAVTFGFALYRAFTGTLPRTVILPIVLNLIFNFAFTPIQFGLRNNVLAAVDILLVLSTLIWIIIALFPQARLLALANLPYLAWVAFATVLQFTITYLNFGRHG
jgi:translocator protein